jgi:hypothetical protein
MQNVLVPTGARMRITAKQKKEKAPCPFQVHCPQVAFEPVEARAQQTFWFCCDMQFFHMSCSSKNPNLPCRLTFCTRRVLVKVSTSSAKSLSSGFWCCCPAQPTKSWKNGASSRDLCADTSTRVHYILRSDHAHAEVLCKGNVALGNPYRTAWYSLSSRSLRICSTSDANINRPCAKEHTLIEKKVKGIYIYQTNSSIWSFQS